MFHESKLIAIHGVADFIIFISYTVLSICLFIVHKLLKNKPLPLKGFIWLFGIFILFCGLTHAIGVLNLYITFYWIDGAVKIICAIFSGLVAINFLPAVSIIKDMRTNEEYKMLENQYNSLKQRVEILEKGTL